MQPPSGMLPPEPAARTRLAKALTHLQAGRYAEARDILLPLGARPSTGIELPLLLGIALAGLGEDAGAIARLRAVAAARPQATHPAQDVLTLLSQHRAYPRAAAFLEAALQAAPADPRLLAAAAEWLRLHGRPEAARPLFARLLAIVPHHHGARIGLAALDAEEGALDRAADALRAVLAEKPDSAAAWGNLGIILGHLGRFAEADAAFGTARRLNPSQTRLAVNHGIATLKSGRLEAGWADLNRDTTLPGHAPRSTAPLLPPLAKVSVTGRRILVIHDRGFGDTIQLARYLPLLVAAGAAVTLWVPPALRRLLAAIPGVVILAEGAPLPSHDWQCPAMRLPEVFETRLATIPAPIRSLSADPADSALWQQRLPSLRPGQRRIGLVWAGSTRADRWELRAVDQRRSIDPFLLAPLLREPGLQWISLQMGGAPNGLPLFDPMGAVRDFADTAAIIATLDAVVSVDTAVAHLAGALGKPVHLLDRFDNCWRWLSGRRDSPWYPSLTIHRQHRWGDWSGPIETVAAALRG